MRNVISLSTLKSLRLLALSSACLITSGCFTPDAIVRSSETAGDLMSDGTLESRYWGEQKDLRVVLREIPESQISTQKSLVVFIHGTPGSWRIFSPQLESEQLSQRATLVAIDRPGWGRSQSDRFEGAITLSEQSLLIGPVLAELKKHFDSNNVVIVGHSLGGSLVPKIAMDFPTLVDAVVILAGDLTDDYPATRWYNSVASWKGVAWFVPSEMKKANQEVIALEPELAAMKEDWHTIAAPILVVQGGKDSLVDPRNADFAKSLITQNAVKVLYKENYGHLFHLKHSDEINALIEAVVMHRDNDFFNGD